jgi:DNA recombination protein RmuC
LDSFAVFIIAIVATALGLGLGWLLAGRATAQVREELAAVRVNAGRADDLSRQLAEANEERALATARIAGLEAEYGARSESYEAQLKSLADTKEALSSQFAETGAQLLEVAQRQFLERADARFKQSEETAGQGLKALLQPVHERLEQYEKSVNKVEAERRDAFGLLTGQIESMRAGTERVSGEAAKLVNALRNAPKARGRWGEQQLKNVLENCGLAEHTDFHTEVNVAGEDGGRLRPDAIIRVPGGRALVIDAKVSLNAYQDAFGAVDEAERLIHLDAHAASMRAHVNGLGNKAYWSQFDDAPDYVIMFVPGEHFLSAALEHAPDLWDFAFEKRVLLATPTNLIAIARTVDAVWKQERLTKEAARILELGKEMYDRLAIVSENLAKAGASLNRTVGQFNDATGSFNRNLAATGKKFRDLNLDTGKRELDDVTPIEALASHAIDVPLIGEDRAANER